MRGRKTIIIAALLALALLLSAKAPAQTLPSAAPPTTLLPALNPAYGQNAIVIPLHGEVDDTMRDALHKGLQKAREEGATVAILDIDTYGGLTTSGMDMSREIKNLHNLHTIAFVNSKAISAGSMISLACEQIVMTPSGSLGDCAPIMVTDQGLQPIPDTERAKFSDPVAEDFRESALNKYDPTLANRMVFIGPPLHWLQSPDGSRHVLTEGTPEYSDALKANWTVVADLPDPILADKSLLTVNTDRALKLGFAKFTAADLPDLAQQLHLNVVDTLTPNVGETLLNVLNTPGARIFLIIIFFTSLYAAFHAPGHGAAEMVATLSLALIVGIPVLSGYAQWWLFLIILVGVFLISLEIFVIPGFGFIGILGIIMVIGGLVMTFVPHAALPLHRDPHPLRPVVVGLRNVALALVGSLVTSSILRKFLPKLPYFNRLILNTTTGTRSSNIPPLPSPNMRTWPSVGMVGSTMSELKPGGSVEFTDVNGHRRTVACISESGYVPAGALVMIRNVDGPSITVRTYQPPTTPPSPNV